MKQTLFLALTFLVSSALIIKIIDYADCSCAALDTYLPADFGYAFSALAVMILTFVLGFIFYAFVLMKLLTNKLFKYGYWILLPVFIFIRPLLSVQGKFAYRDIKHSICNKSTGSGLEAKSKSLSLYEYNYLRSRYTLFPNVPKTAKEIDINYYVDDFLGDFSLEISLSCNRNEKFIFNKNWTIDTATKESMLQHVYYHDDRQ
ncbi:MAG: hypothetical protein V4520_16490 [Bacteroidota bacterium]